MPAAAAEPVLRVPVRRRRLDNGVRVVASPVPDLGFVAVNAWHEVGSCDDPAGRSGLAHLAEHVLHGDAARGRRPAAPGAQAGNATTSLERTSFVDTGPPWTLPDMLARVADRVRRAQEGAAGELDRHRDVVLEEIRQREDPARFGSGLRRSLRLRFGADHPFGRPALGDPDEISRIDRAELEDFLQRQYGAANLVVTVVGSVDPAEAVTAVAAACGDLPGGAGRTRPPVGPAVPGSRREDVEEGQPSGMLRFTFAPGAHGSPHADAGELAVAALAGAPWTVFGADFLAAHGALAASAEYSRCASGASIATLKIVLGPAADLAEAERAVTARLAELARRGLPEDRLTAARARRVKECLTTLCYARTRAERLSQHEAWSGDAGAVDDELPRLRRLTSADVATAVEGFLLDPVLVAYHPEPQGSSSWVV